MKKKALLAVAASLLGLGQATAQNTPVSQMERLDRGVVALPRSSGSGIFLSWRMLGTDNEDVTTFDVIRNNTVIRKDLYATNLEDSGGGKASVYRIVTKVNGEAVDTTEAISPWEQVYNPIKLNRPAGGSTTSGTYTYTPNDMSVGDVDGDGQYELFVKWDPSNSKDNSQNGVTGNVIIDCYRLDGTQLWRVDLGPNIRAGAHYTQYMVYDFDGDGRAELMCKTAPGSKDGQGSYVNQAATDDKIKAAPNNKTWYTSSGRVDGGQEYLTVFSGLTGQAVHTVAYLPNRNAELTLSEADGTFNWAIGKTDTHSYNRGDRYLAAVAYIDGADKPASAVFCRGYYSYAFLWAVSFDGQQIRSRWFSDHRSNSSYSVYTWDDEGTRTRKNYSGCKPTNGRSGKSGTMFCNGNHNLSVADVDGDGSDEIIWGSAALDHDGTLLYGTGFGHGDAMHLGDHCPDRPGLEVFQIHEESPYGWDVHDARTGEILLSANGGGDNGRGFCAQIDANVRGSLFWSSNDGNARRATDGTVASTKHGTSNFRIFWDGDLQEELLDGNKIDKWNGNGTQRLYLNGKDLYDYNGSSTCNSTKNTPCLQADILGDWREEVILWSSGDNATINIFTTNTTTKYRMPTLMHDHTYRMGICWQNVAYNQPPHLGYYLPDAMLPCLATDSKVVNGVAGQEMTFEAPGRYVSTISFVSTILPDGTQMKYKVPEGFEKSTLSKRLFIKGTPQQPGDYRFAVTLKGLGTEQVSDTITFRVADPAGISSAVHADGGTIIAVYDLAGHYLGNGTSRLPRGLYVVRRQTAAGTSTTKLLKAE